MLNACNDPSAVQTAVDLANTLRPIKGEDALETVEQLRDFLDEHFPAGSAGSAGPAGPAEPASSAADRWAGVRQPLTGADLVEVRALRETVRAVLEQASTDAVGAAALINGGLRSSRATPELRHDHDRWWTEVTSDTDRCSTHLAATTLSALASVIATLGPSRLGVCAGPACRATFADLSRNGSKQYCTRTCAHRASVAAYRSRRSPR
ncbi:CGNR zinc finger domain-containing protein [Catenulispora sp. NF23]|uniref:CGNR zinc finger domain-containing protein n=1 Tax=Catenulispora pinistramenti TaxID=2705254 RepID=A0ABS5KKT1_9ACTN|nr:CGNR zinc finger domain-containing protein [Catenulispora pinistramenti]MBS2546651.1 CGNR zinc finger domain-containing protein [Catenulispora pinistramenti]